MPEVNVTELRKNLPAYLLRVRRGDEFQVTSRGKVIARLVPNEDRRAEARKRLDEMRRRCRIGDVVAPLGEKWDVEDGSA